MGWQTGTAPCQPNPAPKPGAIPETCPSGEEPPEAKPPQTREPPETTPRTTRSPLLDAPEAWAAPGTKTATRH
jgi:hypothetical protein